MSIFQSVICGLFLVVFLFAVIVISKLLKLPAEISGSAAIALGTLSMTLLGAITAALKQSPDVGRKSMRSFVSNGGVRTEQHTPKDDC